MLMNRSARWQISLTLPILWLAGCAINPVTGERELALISEGQEVELGTQVAADVERSLGLVDDPALQEYVEDIGQRMARDSERPELPWSFGVIDDPTPNAFAVPGGYIYVTRGMMSLMNSEAELAAVIGHEIGHVTARHSVVQLSRQQLAQLGLGIGMILSPEVQQFGQLLEAGLSVLFLRYSREHERQADELGFRYMREHGYDVNEMANVFVSLQQSAELAGRSALPGWLSSHPAEPERIEAARERAASLETPQEDPFVGREQYLEQLDGMIYGQNPRNGFFRGGYYYHPELEFQLEVPEDWERQNLPIAVVANQPDGEAAMQLTLAEAADAEQAAEQLFGQEGIRRVSSSSEELHGNPAVISRFQAQTEQGVLEGYAAHIVHGTSTFQLLTFSPQPLIGRYEGLFRSIVRGFQPLTDRSLLNVEPQTLEIVEIDEAMTLAEFNRRQPSSIPLEELALINRLQDAETRIEAGTAIKRVVGDEPG
jgi:predicted Zn-dependent protease